MALKRRLKKKSRTRPLKMIKVHYCNNCHYVWEKASDEQYCPYCSSELYTILKLTCQCWQNLQKIYVSSEEKQSEVEEEEKKLPPPKEPSLEDILPFELESMPALAVEDRRSEIEDQRRGHAGVRHVMLKLLSRDEILAANDLPTEQVDVPEWQPDGYVLVRALTAAEWIDVGRMTMKSDNGNGATDDRAMLQLMLKIPAMCIVDANGQRLFSDADIEALGKKNPLPLRRIMDTVQRLSDLDRDAAKKA